MGRITKTAMAINRDARTVTVTTCGECSGLLIVGDKYGNMISTHMAEGERVALIEALGGADR